MADNLGVATDGDPGFGSVSGDEASFDDFGKNVLKLFKEVSKYMDTIAEQWDKMSDSVEKTTDALGGKTGGGKIGMGAGFTRAQVGAAVGVAAGSMYMSMAPNTMSAVTQRIGADSYAGMAGMSSRQAILQANKQVGGGATSAMSPVMAQMSLMYGGGYGAGSKSANNIMSQMSGLSAQSGMSNEAAAASVAGINGMNFLRMGVRIRDNQGNLKPISTIVNDVYRFLYRGRQITPEEADLLYNPGSKSYQTLLAVTGGDQGLMQQLQSGLRARAKAGTSKKYSAAMNSKDPNKMLDLMGVDKSSPVRSNFRFNSSENRKLAATEEGLVGGYNVATRTTAAVNDGFSAMADLLGPINDGLMTLKGILQTLPNAGNAGGAIATAGSTAASLGSSFLQYKLLSKFLGGGGAKAALPALGTAATKGGSLLSKAGPALSSAGKFLGNAAKFGGKALPVVGTAMSAFGGYNDAKKKGGFDWGSVLKSAGYGAAGGAAVGAMGFGVAAAPGALIGALLAGGGNALGQLFGMGGESSNGMNIGHASTPKAETAGANHMWPVPSATPVSSEFGPRPGAAARAAKQGQRISSNHRGIDLATPSGTPITAASEGKVSRIGNDPNGYGSYVDIKHLDGTSSRYAHLRSILVTSRQQVKAGQVIGKSGGGAKDPGRGNSRGAHLHFETLDEKGVQYNPRDWFKKRKGVPQVLSSLNEAASKVFKTKKAGWSSSSYASPSILAAFGQTIVDGKPVSYDDLEKVFGKKTDDVLAQLPGGKYDGNITGNKKDLMKLISSKGFKGDALKTAYAIAIAESGGRSNAYNGDASTGDDSYGLYQINMIGSLGPARRKKFNLKSNQDLFNPSTNAGIAAHMSQRGNNWSAWSSYKTGTYMKHLKQADAVALEARVGGEASNGMNIGAPAGSSANHGGGGSSNATVNSNSNVTINLDMKVNIAQGSVQEAERLVKLVGEKLRKDATLRKIASSL
jgi:murein DD-endopeptidase MepM/ murein hydrolase activator NlpD